MRNSANNPIKLLVFLAFLVLVNVFGQYFFFQYDFTEDKRYSLTGPTKDLLKEQDDIIFVRVLLSGDFPAGFKRLERSVRELLDDFRSLSPFIEYSFENPLEGSVGEINQRLETLRQDGIHGIQLRIDEKEGRSQKSIFPYAVFHFGKRKYVVNLLEPQVRGVSEEIWMNNSINLLEYKFAHAIQKLKQETKPTILFTTGQGELNENQTARLENKLRQYYQVGRVNLDSVIRIRPEVDLLIVAKPTRAFDFQKQFLLDQYLMQGGHIIWMIDRLNVNLDSINRQKFYIPEPYPLGLDDMWFKYGIRILPNLVQDLSCSRIPQVVGVQGDQPQIEQFNWYYHVLATPESGHPIVNNLDRINLYSPSTIDTVQTPTAVKKTILLTSSQYSRYQLSPARMTFDILQYPQAPERFDKPFQPLAVLLEGYFESYFKNKLTPETEAMLTEVGTLFLEESERPGKMIFVSDGDFAKNLYDPHSEKISPIGFNKWENYTFIGNEDFITNSVEYLIDDRGVISARTKKIKLRLIDPVKASENDTLWRFVNFAVPIGFLLLFGLVFHSIRKRKFRK
jgi:ABC-2 type transport system permease protein